MKSDCLPSSQRHLWVLCPITAKPRDKRLYLPLFPNSCEDQGSGCSSKTEVCLHQEPLAGDWHGMLLLALFGTFRFSFLLLLPSLSTAQPCSGWENIPGWLLLG